MKLAWLRGPNHEMGGYTRVGHYLVAAVTEAGAEMVGYRDWDWDLRLAIATPRAHWIGRGEDVVDDLVWHTMFEAHPLPPLFVKVLNRSRAVWVPAQWNAEMFRESGVTRPIFVSGYGVLQREFHYCERKREDDAPYRFLWCGTSIGDGKVIGGRKGAMTVVKAFRKLNLPNAELILKANARSAVGKVNIPNVRVIASDLDDEDYLALHQLADCFVYPSHGEGFGLQPLEAMATGLPVIAPAYSGMADFVNDRTAVVLPTVGEERATMYERRFDTEPLWWASYDVMDVCDRMLWCYEHREEAISLGKQAAGIVRDRWTWERAGRDGLAVLDSVMEV